MAKDSTSIYTVENDDAAMNAAILTAKATIHQFDTAIASGDSNYSYFA